MKKLIAFQRHAFSVAQTEELAGLGFTAEIREVVLPSDSTSLGKILDDAGLAAGDGVTFVAPAIIASRFTAQAKSRRIRVLLAEAKPNPAARTRTPVPASATEEVKAFLKSVLPNALEETAEGLVALGQAPFVHVKYVEV